MKILLKYWYTGELLPSWEDDDIVVEFTYAAGKYEMTQVLKMLDDLLGIAVKNSEKSIELLKMAQVFSLNYAEARLLKQIVQKVSKIASGADFLDMFALTNISLNEQNFGASEIFKSVNDLLSEQGDKDACILDIKFMALACKLGMKHVENKFLKRIVGTVKSFNRADQLFALVDLSNKTNKKDLKENDLLVRAN